MSLSQGLSRSFLRDYPSICKLFGGGSRSNLLGVKINLPFTPDLVRAYGTYANQFGNADLIVARVSVLYDVLNQIVLEAFLRPYSESEPV